jgi:hypothetical protein
VLWLVLLGGLGAVLFGSRALFERGQRALELGLAIVPALPTLGLGAMIVAMMVFGGPWR